MRLQLRMKMKFEVFNEESSNESSSSNHDQDTRSSIIVKKCLSKQTINVRFDHRTKYKSSWESLID